MTMPRALRRSGREPEHPGSHDGLDDRALVARVTEGDGGALEALYGRYGRACYGLARRILTDEHLAADVVQEVFLTVWRDASTFDASRGGFSSWLLSMTHHKAVDAVRREENHRKRRSAAELLEERPADTPQVDDEVWSTIRGERVRAAMQLLPDAQREALVLAYFGGYTQREIAGITDTPLGTVKTRMLMGMRRLKEGLDGIQTSAPDAPLSVHNPRTAP
ncbi:MAG: sigma-70 family RNA polymerase sigma factor [Frankiaceae bacterium]|nr:sigma-70 family RNA polymerase sigma factor [Frankiaceae bacterium]